MSQKFTKRSLFSQNTSFNSQKSQFNKNKKRISISFQLKARQNYLKNKQNSSQLSLKSTKNIKNIDFLSKTNIQLLYLNERMNKKFPESFSMINNLSCLEENINLTETSFLQQTNFPVLKYTIGQLIEFSIQILKRNQFAVQYISEQSISKLVNLIASKYNFIAYHNFSHAFSLMQLFHHCVRKNSSLSSLVSEQLLFYACIAGLAHDLNHKGTNNAFQIKQNSKIAQESNNVAVLEHMHFQTFFKILEENPSINIFNSTKNYDKSKKCIIRLILATDMSQHFENINKFQSLEFDIQKIKVQDQKWFIVEQLFHACDVGNSTQNFQNYISWAALLSHEFNEQYKQQIRLNLEPSKGFQFHNLKTLYNDQLWFVGKMVLPLWKQFSERGLVNKQLIEMIQDNLKKIEQKKRGYEQDKC